MDRELYCDTCRKNFDGGCPYDLYERPLRDCPSYEHYVKFGDSL